MAQPACQPPEPGSELAALRVVGHYLRIVIDTPLAKCLDQIVAARQWVPAVEPGLLAGQLRIDVCKHGARNVSFSIRANPCLRIEQIMPDIDDAPACIVQVPA